MKDGSQLAHSCEAALGSPARPLESEAVLAKIAQLSHIRAPGLHDAVVRLQQHLAEGQIGRLEFRGWVRSFYD